MACEPVFHGYVSAGSTRTTTKPAVGSWRPEKKLLHVSAPNRAITAGSRLPTKNLVSPERIAAASWSRKAVGDWEGEEAAAVAVAEVAGMAEAAVVA